MRLKDAAAALVAATTFGQRGAMGLVVVTKTITETATAPVSGDTYQNTLLPEKNVGLNVKSELATNMQPAEELVVASSTSITWTTTTVKTASTHSAIMSLGCDCKINEENGFIDCPSGDSTNFESCGFFAGVTSTKTSTRHDNAAHTNTVGQSNSTGAKQTAGPPEGPPANERRAAFEAGDNSMGFIDQCSYQPGTRFTIESTPVNTNAPTYSYPFNPSLLGKRGPFSMDKYGQLFDDSGRMGTFDSYSKFRLRSPVAFKYPSLATWSACGTGNTLLFGNTDQFYQCGNVSFPAIWNNVPPGYTEVSAQEGCGLTTCVKVKLVWTQVPESELKKRQQGPDPASHTSPHADCLTDCHPEPTAFDKRDPQDSTDEASYTWPVTNCPRRDLCPPKPTRLAKRGLQDDVLGDGISHVAYDSTTATFAFRQEVVTEAPGEDGSPGSVYTIPARTMVFKEELAYATTAAKNDKRQDNPFIVAPVRTERTAQSLKLPQRPPSPTVVAARGEDHKRQDGGFINLPVRTETTAKSLMVPKMQAPTDTLTTNLHDRPPAPTGLVVRDEPSPLFLNTYTRDGATVVQQFNITDSPGTGIPGFTWYFMKTWTKEPITVTEGAFALERVMTFGIQVIEGEPTTLYATHTTTQTTWAPIVTPTGLFDRLYAGDSNWPNWEPAPARERRQNPNPCQMEHGCSTATKTSTHTISAVYTVIGDMTYSFDARTTTKVFYDNPEPGDGPGLIPRDVSDSPQALELQATYTVTGTSTTYPTKTAQVSGAPPPTGGSTKVVDTDGSKQLIAAPIGMAFFCRACISFIRWLGDHHFFSKCYPVNEWPFGAVYHSMKRSFYEIRLVLATDGTEE